MANINLLPWREELRKERNQQYLLILVFFVILTAGLWGVVHFHHVSLINYQLSRNDFLDEKIVYLDKKIEEIHALEKEKERLKARIQAIEGLQGNRPLVVRLFDEMVASLPEGVSLISVAQKKDKINIKGVAQSNARVSSFMRNLESSEWLKTPKLDIIQAEDAKGRRVSNFNLSFSQVVPSQVDEDEI